MFLKLFSYRAPKLGTVFRTVNILYIPEKPGVIAAIFLANSCLSTSVFNFSKCTLKIDALFKKKKKSHEESFKKAVIE